MTTGNIKPNVNKKLSIIAYWLEMLENGIPNCQTAQLVDPEPITITITPEDFFNLSGQEDCHMWEYFWVRNKFNELVPFSSVPDRGLFLLQSHGVQYTFNEMITIQTHDGLYDEANKKYLISFIPGQKPRTSLPNIVHQADLMAARIEFEREWLPKLKGEVPKEDNFKIKTTNKTTKDKALGSIKSSGLNDLLQGL